MLPFPGALLVWSGDRPYLETIRIPPEGLMLGRELIEQALGANRDDRISRSHARICVEDHQLRITDLASRNGTYSNGRTVAETVLVTPPSIVRTGRTVWVTVPDVRRYDHIPLQRRGRLVVAGTLDPVCRELDAIARAESNVTICGPLSISRELAANYAATVGGDVVRFDPDTMKVPLERLIGQRTFRTLVIELGEALLDRDLDCLATWLETDTRIVTLARAAQSLKPLPAEILARLAARRIDLPAQRYDEMPTTVVDLVRDLVPDAAIHPSLIERCLVDTQWLDEDGLQDHWRRCVLHWRTTGHATLRGPDFDYETIEAVNDCQHPHYHLVAARLAAERRAAQILPAGGYDASWALRRLCVDGVCTGVIEPDGRCGVCGKSTPQDSPYR